MSHLPILPIFLPMVVGAVLLLLRGSLDFKRGISLLATFAQLPLAAILLLRASEETLIYTLGDWLPPFGIVLVVDRLSALMLLITAVLAFGAMLYALRGDDAAGRNFHPLFQFQLMGITGAFLTGDLFNLFVFFEILLIASYALLLHGAGSARVRAGLHYVLLNLTGSALFLIAVGTLYGVLGTLNMADMAVRVSQLSAADQPLVGAAGMLLLVVFGLKTAVFPLYFWLPRAYSAASAPVAALFAIMTKVGLYSILRVYTLIFGEQAQDLAHMVNDWLWPLALLTLVLGAVGALAAATLTGLIAYLVVLSVGTMLAGLALGTPEALRATLFYLMHSTWITGAFFLLAGVLQRVRGPRFAARLVAGPAVPHPMLLGGIFFLSAMSIVGMPPLSGFIGKLLLLSAAGSGSMAGWLYPVVLGSGLLSLIALSRAGTTLFWRQAEVTAAGEPLDGVRLAAVVILLLASPLLVLFAEPVLAYLDATADQLLQPQSYIDAVLGAAGEINP
ncbi:MAG: monovalent cation/H+ antiporter subunit D [Halopseudomonas sp.]|uniref:monovalent cation/H+ antiporter subunit D n=1 Tax=Halopseudomonas sp. TaxID=2901191 RepID=UPI0030026A2B